jgi:hypothetical protein
MFCPICQLPILRRFRAALARLLTLVVLLALAACEGANDPLAPANEPATDPVKGSATAPSEAVTSGDALALTTGQRIVFTSTRKGGYPAWSH